MGNLNMEYEIGRIKNFEKEILATGICKALLPMSFVCIGEVVKVNYDCSGYKPLSEFEIVSNKEMISLLEKCIFALMNSCEYLINPKKMELSLQTVFYSESKKEIKFAYSPKAVQAEKALQGFTELLKQIENKANERTMSDYLNSIISYIESENVSFMDVINYLGEIKQEIHACE